ncbi:uncharacterized protein LOC129312803 [Prosopis cineraria]|uniref:uncharacterized protein LOC129312803 n=1 Tax=Prosopis cineraria TaxID=364024 RepID=UPI00240EEFDC|nr:uncharacterized protein LOC129312803 [Prosopis cineraria]XP_054811506.1 uncharacterized protein LOC129312803 [Prosopis cineraria]XP_054811507.1 uncharacterized protein LOC129312803 [Prosopis cineraria]
MKPSEEKIDAVLGFLVNKLGCRSSIIAKYPWVVAFSMNRRILPRGAVIEVLLSKGLVQTKSLPLLFMYPENIFLRKSIMCHEKEATELLKLYQDKLELARCMKNGKGLQSVQAIFGDSSLTLQANCSRLLAA